MISLGLFEESHSRITCTKMAKRLDQSMTSSSRMRKLITAAKDSHDSIMINHNDIMTDDDSVMESHARLDKTRLEKKREEEKVDEADASMLPDIDSVIDHLNAKTSRAYRHIESNRKGIRARLLQGYTVADCKRVIDTKVAEWQGTDMEKHLNCETLFRPSKFEKYLNQSPVVDDKYETQADGTRVYKGLI